MWGDSNATFCANPSWSPSEVQQIPQDPRTPGSGPMRCHHTAAPADLTQVDRVLQLPADGPSNYQTRQKHVGHCPCFATCHLGWFEGLEDRSGDCCKRSTGRNKTQKVRRATFFEPKGRSALCIAPMGKAGLICLTQCNTISGKC